MNGTDLDQRVKDYLALRTTMGYRVNSEDRSLLEGFAASVQPHTHQITTEMALRWACGSPTFAAATRAWRLSRLRGFLTYLRTFWPEIEVPGRGLLAKVHRQTPYIYSEQEIVKLLQATQGIKARGPASFTPLARTWRALTCETLFGLLASTGLRVGEAIRLDLNDVQLHEAPPCLVVRETKFRKTRLVPIHPSVADRLQRYVQQRRELGDDGLTHAFFVSERGDRLRHGWISRAWRSLLRSAGVTPTRDGRRPTIHALRHTFAVRRLLEWQRLGMNVTAMIPHLSIYMGHAAPQNTYWYLTATPELFDLAGQSFERFTAGGER